MKSKSRYSSHLCSKIIFTIYYLIMKMNTFTLSKFTEDILQKKINIEQEKHFVDIDYHNFQQVYIELQYKPNDHHW